MSRTPSHLVNLRWLPHAPRFRLSLVCLRLLYRAIPLRPQLSHVSPYLHRHIAINQFLAFPALASLLQYHLLQ